MDAVWLFLGSKFPIKYNLKFNVKIEKYSDLLNLGEHGRGKTSAMLSWRFCKQAFDIQHIIYYPNKRANMESANDKKVSDIPPIMLEQML